MTTDDDIRDLAIHNTIERAIHTIGSMYGIERVEVIDRIEAFIEAEREEQKSLALKAEDFTRAFVSAMEREEEGV
jgi:hypothetical protein